MQPLFLRKTMLRISLTVFFLFVSFLYSFTGLGEGASAVLEYTDSNVIITYHLYKFYFIDYTCLALRINIFPIILITAVIRNNNKPMAINDESFSPSASPN